MKLELKHLAPYLPYGLKIYKSAVNELNEFNLPYVLNHCKPLLKPISDLDKLVRNEFEKYGAKQEYNLEVINLFCEENGVDEIIENIFLSSLPYECVEFMFRNHYDFFGLISEGLAIDIRNLKKVK